MSCGISSFLLPICMLYLLHSANAGQFQRHLLSDANMKNVSKRSHNETKEVKVIPDLKVEESMAGTEAAVLIIVVIVVLSVIGMVVYFVRKFDQLNRSLPTYRYSSLKTEINGVYGPDDKNESQVLVSVSTEEDDFDDDDEEEDEDDDTLAPPTLLVKSQTVMPNKSANGSLPIHESSDLPTEAVSKNEEATMDSDDELLQ